MVYSGAEDDGGGGARKIGKLRVLMVNLVFSH